MISFHKVSKKYPNGIEALRNVNLDIKQGEFLFISGPSGAGKTTLIKLILMMEKATEGDILIFDRNIQKLRESSVPYLRRNIGAVFQDFKLIETRSVYENVALSLEILGMPQKEIRRKVETVLEGLGLDRLKNSYPPMLSGGEQQRTSIARALVIEPALILADEPTGNLDWDLSIEIMEMFRKINEKGTTVVIATHDRFLLSKYRKRTVILNRGFIIEDRVYQPEEEGVGTEE